MPIKRKQTVEIPLSGGIDTKTDEKLVEPPSLLDIQNGVHTKHGSVIKRPGYTVLGHKDTTTTDLADLRNLATRDNELLALDGTSLYSYVEELDQWTNRGPLRLTSVQTRPVADRPTAQSNPDFAKNTDIEVYAWEDGSNGLYAAVYSVTTGAALSPAKLIDANGVVPRVCSIPGHENIVIVYINTVENSISTHTVSKYNPAGTTQGSSLTDVHSDNLLDAAATGSQEHFDIFFAYKESGANDLKVGFIRSNGQVGSPGFGYVAPFTFDGGAPDAPVNYISVTVVNPGGDGTSIAEGCFAYILMAYASGTIWARYNLADGGAEIRDSVEDDFWNYLYTDSGNTVLASQSVRGTAVAYTSDPEDEVAFLFEIDGGSSDFFNSRIELVVGTGSGGGLTVSEYSVFARHAALAGHAFRIVAEASLTDDTSWPGDADQRKWFVPVCYSSTLQTTTLLLDYEGLPVARINPATTTFTDSQVIPHVHVDLDNQTAEFVVPDKKRLAVDLGQTEVFTQSGLQYCKVDFSNAQHQDHAETQGSTYVGGGLIWQYDGNSPIEAGFLFYPENLTHNAVGTAETRQYRFYWEWTDEQGKRLQSAGQTFTVQSDTPPDEDAITWTAETLWHTRKQGERDAPILAGYRTVDGGTALYRFTSLSSPTQNDPDTNTITVVDDMSDEDLISNDLDYQNAGELDNVAPLSGDLVLSYDDRLFIAQGNELYFSKRPATQDQPGFNEGLLIAVPPDGGVITGLSVLDGKLVIFKRDRVYMVSGDGPNNLGFGEYSFPRVVSSDTGCKDHRSICQSPLGVFFQSDKGIYVLNRGEAVNYIGAPVEIYNDQTFVAATLLPTDNRIYFLTDSGRTLVYDYLLGLWSTFTEHAGLDAILSRETYYYLKDSTSVYKESDTFYTDNTAAVSLVLETPWIKPVGLQRFWRAIRAAVLGNYSSEHDIRVFVYIDYKSYPHYVVTWDPEDALATETWGDEADWGDGDLWGVSDSTRPDRVYQFSHVLKTQKVESIKFKFVEVPPEDPGASFELTSLALDVGVYDGVFRLPSTKQV